MGLKLLRGNRAVKIASGDIDAFDSPNFPPLATTGVGVTINSSTILPPPQGRFSVSGYPDIANVLVVKLVPGFSDAGLKQMFQVSHPAPSTNTHTHQLQTSQCTVTAASSTH
jgi:L-asparaginase/Glu-tRNA(Gln) amidotransferase subunit D